MPEPSQSDVSASNTEPAISLFNLLLVNDNQTGWGPNNVPEKYQDLPYQKFSKSDRIGKVSVRKLESIFSFGI